MTPMKTVHAMSTPYLLLNELVTTQRFSNVAWIYFAGEGGNGAEEPVCLPESSRPRRRLVETAVAMDAGVA